MATSFPGGIDAFTNPISTTPLASVTIPHSSEHINANDAITAVETKLGAGATTPAAGKALLGGSVAGSIWDRLARKNLLTNGSTRLAQRAGAIGAAVGLADNTYQLADRWKTLWDTAGGGWALYTHSSVPASSSSRSILFNSGGNSAKAGQIQILPWADTLRYRSQAVSLQAQMFATAEISDVRMAVLSWSGTADAPTDPVATWNAAGTNPTLAANWAYISTPVNLSLTTLWVIKKLENQVVPANCNNLAVMFWSEDVTQTVGTQSWAFTDAQLELGAVCTAYEGGTLAEDWLRCLPYYQKTYPHDTAPGAVASAGEILAHAGTALAASTAGNLVLYALSGARFGVPMHHTPTVTVYDPNNGAAGSIQVGGGATHRTGVTAGAPASTHYMEYLSITNASATAITDRQQIQLHATAEAEL